MNRLLGFVVVVGALYGSLAVAASLAVAGSAADRPLATAETLVGAWNGRWIGESRAGEGPMGLVLARTPGNNQVVGQFTFITGGISRSMRYEGTVTNGRVEFPLVANGQIVLEPVDAMHPGTATQLRGEWTDVRGALPAPEGIIELHRAN